MKEMMGLDQGARIAYVLKEAMRAGVPFRKAAIVVATSIRESAVTFGVPRDEKGVLQTINCYPYRPILRLEHGRTSKNPLRKSITEDSVIMDYLGSLPDLSGRKGAYYLNSVGTDRDTAPERITANLLEIIIDRRNGAALEHFAAGPTQLYLAYSPLTKGKIIIQNRFPTWEDLFHFYTARTAKDVFDGSWFDCYPTTATAYPTDSSYICGDTSSPNCVEQWLSRYQTGMVDWKTQQWSQYATDFLSAVRAVWQIARSIGYPTIR